MARTTDELNTIIDEVLAFVAGRVTVTAAFLFGSYAAGRPGPLSDIDIAIFSPEFEGWTLSDRMELALDVRLKLYMDVQVHLYPSTILASARPSNFCGHLIETGWKIA